MKQYLIQQATSHHKIELGLEEYGAIVDMSSGQVCDRIPPELLDEVLKNFAEEGFHINVVVNSLWSHYENE